MYIPRHQNYGLVEFMQKSGGALGNGGVFFGRDHKKLCDQDDSISGISEIMCLFLSSIKGPYHAKDPKATSMLTTFHKDFFERAAE